MRRMFEDRRTALLLLSPALIVYTLVMVIPVLWSLGYTLMDGNAISGFTYAGLANFIKLLHDADVLHALTFTLRYAVVITVGQVVLGYALALFYVFVLRKSGSLVRTLTFFPVVLPTVAVGLLFHKMFEIAPHNGIVNAIVNILGGSSHDWFGTASSAFLVLATMDIWRSMGFYAILLYTGLLDIPEELLESARVDGASGWTLVRHIVLPLSLPVLVSSLIFSINGTLKVFDSVLALTNGGPGSGTTPLTLYMYRTAFAYGDYGYGSTIALLLTLLSLMVTLFIFRSSRRDVTAP